MGLLTRMLDERYRRIGLICAQRLLLMSVLPAVMPAPARRCGHSDLYVGNGLSCAASVETPLGGQ
ncbi:hypothetical protein [Pseudomonas antarctica]|uniref:hypothetical protein n=1 Tax=Pseudomonas antarctica TaxID=219572 RepID=UPI003F74F48E